ncbi:MAG: serine hydrolase [Bacteroidia bacterium]|nr:serine hydrolase [Bacteroidia bacterium]
MRYLRWIGFIVLFLAFHGAKGQQLKAQMWVDSVFSTMNTDEKIGQMFMVATYSNKEESDYRQMEEMVRKYHLGGLIFMQGTPENQVRLINRYQRAADIPLLISQDAEWGLSMRLKGVPRYPYNMTLGAIQNDSLIYRLGKQMARDLKRVGVSMNFAPVVDINNNPQNPVINFRSFGEDKYNVARKGIMISNGLQDGGVIACAKHFPGHGDTDTDSHFGLPVIKHSQIRLDTLELYPFMKLSKRNIGAMMVAHLKIPVLDSTPNRATTLSPNVVQALLREKIGYKGLIVTDALNMHGVSKYFPKGQVALEAFKAGNDILLYPENIPLSILNIKKAIQKGEISKADLDERVRRILLTKYRSGLTQWKSLSSKDIKPYLFTKESAILKKELYEAAITLAKNDQLTLPLKRLEKRKIAYLQVGGSKNSTMLRTLMKYGQITPIYLPENFSSKTQGAVMKKLSSYNTVIIGVFGMNKKASDKFGVDLGTRMIAEQLSRLGKDVVTTLFGSPYALKYFGKEKAILVAYEPAADAQAAAAKAIFGGIKVNGRLPVTASDRFRVGTGRMILEPIRFGFSIPEEEGLDSKKLKEIDEVIETYIKKKAMPGAAVLVMKGNNIVYEKGYGRTTYSSKSRRVNPYIHTYDLASVTKVASTTVAVMYLEEKGLLDLDAPIVKYIPKLKGTNKAKLTIRRLLQHNSGLPGWLSVYQQTFSNPRKKSLDKKYYSFYPSRSHDQKIAPALYGSTELDNLFWKTLKEAPLNKTTRVRYSDVGLILTGIAIENISKKTLDELVDYIYYERLGMNRTTFNPHLKKWEKYCPPTESDLYWRQAVIQGYVHDPNSAIMGGVAGHAGLFSNVYDLAKLMYMLKNGGSYGGQRFLKQSTIDAYTRQQLTYNRKGLGWDKPARKGESSSPCSRFASRSTFGHTGFTGTGVWVDPKNDLIFIFLANRTFPDQGNRLLYRENVREKVHDKVYEAIASYKKDRRPH